MEIINGGRERGKMGEGCGSGLDIYRLQGFAFEMNSNILMVVANLHISPQCYLIVHGKRQVLTPGLQYSICPISP